VIDTFAVDSYLSIDDYLVKREIVMQTRFTLKWDLDALADALGMKPAEVKEYLSDGRRASFLIERRLKKDNAGWKLAPSEGADYDLSDPEGGKWEVRSITRGGVYFNPSNQVGSSRSFDEGAFLAKLSKIKGFILSDIVDFPTVDVFVIPSKTVRKWYKAGDLGAGTRVSRKTFLDQLAPTI
jgi:hypothetical protein